MIRTHFEQRASDRARPDGHIKRTGMRAGSCLVKGLRRLITGQHRVTSISLCKEKISITVVAT